MIIDYNAVEWKENPGFKGGEGSFNNKMYDDGTNKMMKGCLKPGCSIGYHKHEGTCEIIFIVSSFRMTRSSKYLPSSASTAPKDIRTVSSITVRRILYSSQRCRSSNTHSSL